MVDREPKECFCGGKGILDQEGPSYYVWCNSCLSRGLTCATAEEARTWWDAEVNRSNIADLAADYKTAKELAQKFAKELSASRKERLKLLLRIKELEEKH